MRSLRKTSTEDWQVELRPVRPGSEPSDPPAASYGHDEVAARPTGLPDDIQGRLEQILRSVEQIDERLQVVEQALARLTPVGEREDAGEISAASLRRIREARELRRPARNAGQALQPPNESPAPRATRSRRGAAGGTGQT